MLLLLLVSSSAVAYAERTPPLPGAPTYDISVEEAHKMLVENQEQIILLDVRTEKEYSAEYIDIDGAELMNIPVSDLESRIDELENSKVIIVYCRSGGRSSTAKNTLAQHDFIAYNMLGGITAWKEAKYDTSMSTGAETTLPSISPVHTPAAASTPVTSHTPTPASEEEEKQVPGFELIFAFAAISLIAWRCRVLRKQ